MACPDWRSIACRARRAAVVLAVSSNDQYSVVVDRQDQDLVIRRFGLTLALFDLGEAMMRQRLRRQHATATEPEIDAMITDWLQRRPGAKDGDCPGRVRPWLLP